jgi:hypothetical protein
MIKIFISFVFTMSPMVAFSQTLNFNEYVATSITPIVTNDFTTIVTLNDSTTDYAAKIVGINKVGTEKWKLSLAQTVITSSISGPHDLIIAAGRAVYEECGVVYAIAQDGKVKWSVRLDRHYYPAAEPVTGADNRLRLVANSSTGQGVKLYFVNLIDGSLSK